VRLVSGEETSRREWKPGETIGPQDFGTTPAGPNPIGDAMKRDLARRADEMLAQRGGKRMSREHVLSHLYVIFYDNQQGLGLCGCGNPEAAYDLIRDLLSLAPFYEDSRWKTAEALTGNIPGAHHIVLGAMDRAGLIEHGSSQNGAWLTDKGTWCLAAMRTAEFDDLDQHGYPHDGEACTDACWRLPVDA
jgi:hypothetical protein